MAIGAVYHWAFRTLCLGVVFASSTSTIVGRSHLFIGVFFNTHELMDCVEVVFAELRMNFHFSTFNFHLNSVSLYHCRAKRGAEKQL